MRLSSTKTFEICKEKASKTGRFPLLLNSISQPWKKKEMQCYTIAIY
jgi:hypothetical protein